MALAEELDEEEEDDVVEEEVVVPAVEVEVVVPSVWVTCNITLLEGTAGKKNIGLSYAFCQLIYLIIE